MNKLFVEFVATRKSGDNLTHFYRVYGTHEEIELYQKSLIATSKSGKGAWSTDAGHPMFATRMKAGNALKIVYSQYQQRWFFDLDERRRYEQLAMQNKGNKELFTYYMDKAEESCNLAIPQEIKDKTPCRSDFEIKSEEEISKLHEDANDNPQSVLDLPF